MQLGRIHVLTQDDWKRIQYALNKKQIEDEKIRKAREEREQLKAKSQALVKNWTNTVQVMFDNNADFTPSFHFVIFFDYSSNLLFK